MIPRKIEFSLYLNIDHALFLAALVNWKVKELDRVTGPPLAVLFVKIEAKEMTGHGRHDHVAPLVADHVRKLVDLVELGHALSLEKINKITCQLSRGEICSANFIPPANGASQGNFSCPQFDFSLKRHKLAIFEISAHSVWPVLRYLFIYLFILREKSRSSLQMCLEESRVML